MPNEAAQIAHLEWEVAQFQHDRYGMCHVLRLLGRTHGFRISLRRRNRQINEPICVWAERNMLYSIFYCPTRISKELSSPFTGARLICAPRPFVGPSRRTRLWPWFRSPSSISPLSPPAPSPPRRCANSIDLARHADALGYVRYW